MGVKVDGRHLHHLRFADDIVLITPTIQQAERMLADFDCECGKIGLQLNLTKTMFMRNGMVPAAPFTLNGTNVTECFSYVYLGREVNMMNDLAPELSRRKRAAWGAFKTIEGVVKKTKNIRLRAHLFDSAVLPALTYATETWTLREQEEHAVGVIQRAIERTMLGVSRYTQVQRGIGVPNSVVDQRSGTPSYLPRNRRLDGPDTSCDIVMTVGPERLPTGSLGTSNEHLDDRRPDGQTSSRKLCAKGTRRYVSLEPETFTGLLWLATGMNGDVAGARSRLSMNNGTTGDTVFKRRCSRRRTQIRVI